MHEKETRRFIFSDSHAAYYARVRAREPRPQINDTEGHWKQRSFRSEKESRQFDAECQHDSTEKQRQTQLEAVPAYPRNTPILQENC